MNPEIREAHAQPVVKAKAALGDGKCHAGKPAHILSDEETIRLYFLCKGRSHLEIGKTGHIRIG